MDTEGWSLQTLANFLDAQRQGDLEREEIRRTASEAAIVKALGANDRRLDTMNGFREMVEFQINSNVTRPEFESEIRPLRDEMARAGKPNWLLLIGSGSVAVAVLSAGWVLIGLQISVAIAPQSILMEQLKSTQQTAISVAADAADHLRQDELALHSVQEAVSAGSALSRTDRASITERVGTLERMLNEGRAARGATDAKIAAELIEIETQFCSGDDVRNLIHANDLRTFAMLWAKTFPGSIMPINNAYYPVVCNRQITSSTNSR